MTSDETKQKRNRPCENCRAHRRRCIPTQTPQCERCTKKKLSCIYKFTVKPTMIKNVVPASKRMRLLDQVRDMEETMDALEDQVHLILAYNNDESPKQLDNTENTIHHSESISPLNEEEWTVTIQPTKHGIQLQTSVHTVSELVQFLTQSVGCFSTPQRTPNYYSNHSQQTMKVTLKMLQVEESLRQIFSKIPAQKQFNHSQLVINDSTFYDHTRRASVLYLVDSFFNCVRNMIPIVAPYYHPLIIKQPDSTLAYSLACFTALSTCVIHVDEKTLPCHRSDFGIYLYQAAHEKLRDDVFDEPHSIETIIALLTMSQASMIILRNDDTRLYIHLAWQMLLAMRDDCTAILRKFEATSATSPTTPELARAETWRRLFYGVRYMLIHVRIVQADTVDFGSFLKESNIGYPRPLFCEMENQRRKRMVEVYNLFVRLDDCYISSNVDAMGYRLFAGELDKVRLYDVSYIEHRLFSFWQSLPSDFRLTTTPMEYLDPASIYTCQDLHILYLNQMYYSQWLTLETRLMQTPCTADLKDTTWIRLDGGRALLIVSVCADTLTHIFQVLHQNESCMLELHWLLVTTDALRMLTKAANTSVRNRAQYNLRICLSVLMSQLQPKPQYYTTSPSPSISSTGRSSFTNMNHGLSPGNSSTSTISDSLDEVDEQEDWNHHDQASSLDLSTDLSPMVVYYGEIKKSLESYFSDDI
ncbi:uncharacterized protein BX664DRAFT_342553, partial [Halteromyces radiatus]|uniref:uncharacterized protein n=1 Tax=Halteromyces radiatus TaxID=101107 RepID=UPI0022207F65